MTAADKAGPLFLGLDLSTQQLKGVLISRDSVVVHEINILLDDEFPEYKTQNGRHVAGECVTAPVLLWVEAIDRLMAKVGQTGLAEQVQGISGAAQQHGTVYWNAAGIQAVERLDGKVPLVEQLADAFALADSPIWEDSSTHAQCEQLERAAGSAAHLAQLTGSAAYERFSGTQIAKIKQTQPAVWAAVARVSLVSSFVASVLAGRIAPIDVGDAAGTNIYDIQNGVWARALCDSIDPTLVGRLGADIVMADAPVGTVAQYFAHRYGFRPDCTVVAFTGDNLSAYGGFESLFASAAHSPAIVSLGTSDTILFPLSKYPYAGDAALIPPEHLGGHVLPHPTDRSRYIAMLCYKNGSLARDWVRRTAFGDDALWSKYAEAALDVCPLAPRLFGFYYRQTEILPRAKGIHRFERIVDGDFQSVERFEPAADACAIIESQILAMRADYAHKSDTLPPAVAVTGGASSNPALLSVIANVFNVPVFAVGAQKGSGNTDVLNPAMPAYGGAVRALSHWRSIQNDAGRSSEGGYVLHQVCSPNPQTHALYSQSLGNYEQLRNQVSRNSNPEAS
ncbi:hypothetical protein EV175_005274 [Coemansia sp. RSA 1933]|nr:hypothetical protein EV175_005274 [Coemansia sp. RSA 1933]